MTGLDSSNFQHERVSDFTIAILYISWLINLLDIHLKIRDPV